MVGLVMKLNELQHTETASATAPEIPCMLKFSSLKLDRMERYERIDKAIRESGKQKGEIAALCKVRNSAVSQWISGESKSLKPENLFALAKATGFSAIWLAIGEGPERIVPDIELDGEMSSWGNETPLDADEVFVPLFKEVQLAAGTGSTQIQEITDRKIRFALSTLRECGVQPENAVAAQVTGNSMERLILQGSTVGIDTGSTAIIDGDIYAIDHDGMLRVKYVYRLPGGGLRLRSENQEEYPDEIISPEMLDSVRIIGWVFWWSTVRRRRGSAL